MNQEDIIRMAREVGFVANVSEEHWGEVPYAKLCHPTPTSTALFKMLERFFHMAQAAEREACAQAARTAMLGVDWVLTERVLKAIRKRGEKE